jgi:hypothetical protein
MTVIVVLFDLKAGVDPALYEAWARRRDLPGINALPSVRNFRVLRSAGLLNGQSSPHHYVELIEIDSLEAFRADVRAEAIQEVAREFREFADSPQFIVTNPL